jgi:hypothetical protein
MSGFAMFSLKDPSLLAFQERRNDFNIKSLYLVNEVPSDTQTRELLDAQQPVLRLELVGGKFLVFVVRQVGRDMGERRRRGVWKLEENTGGG